MIVAAIVLFALAAVAGASMAIFHFRGRTPPRPLLAAVHGVLAATGLVVLLLVVVNTGSGAGVASALGVFLLAALGGFTLLSFHLRRRALPGGLIIGHGLLAVAGFVILLVAAFMAGF